MSSPSIVPLFTISELFFNYAMYNKTTHPTSIIFDVSRTMQASLSQRIVVTNIQ